MRRKRFIRTLILESNERRNQMKLEQLEKALNDFHSDTSRTQEETLEGLESISEELEVMIDGLRMTIASGE